MYKLLDADQAKEEAAREERIARAKRRFVVALCVAIAGVACFGGYHLYKAF